MRRSLLAGIAVVALAGCGGDSEVDADPTATPTAAAPTPAPTPAGPPPLTGITLREKTSSVRVPTGWKRGEALADYASSADSPRPREYVQLSDSVDIGCGGSLRDQVKAVRLVLRGTEDATFERKPDVDLDGTPAYRFRIVYDGTKDEVNEMIGTVRDGRSIGLTLNVKRSTLKRRPQLLASIVASWRWR